MSRPMPPPLVLPPSGLWRTTPPAIFAPILGLLGLGLLLRALGGRLAIDPLVALADAGLGAAVLLHGFALLAYAGKLARRPGALVQDMGTLPGRAGVAAALAALHLSAAALVPHAPALAMALTLAGLGAQAAYMAALGWLMLRGPVEGRRVSPVFHLIFVGHILAPFALAPLGWTGLAQALLWLGLPTAALIWALALPGARATLAPLRPTLAIHAAPASVLASGFALLGWPVMALALALWALVLAVGLAGSARWLLAAGFSPMWGALTFPLAAFAQAMLRALGTPGLALAAGLAVVASVAIPWIAWRILRDWPGGKLAQKTNAAVA